MRYLTMLVLCLGLALTAPADLIISEIMSSSSHTNSAANADWWELYNNGASAVDLTGYSWDDDSATPGSADFNGAIINPGQAIIICGETIGQEAAWAMLWGLSGVTVINLGNTEFQNLSSAGDTINLFDATSTLIASTTIGAATSGFSFEYDADGQAMGLSVNGENGAFQATLNAGGGPDVGSPGTVVPEPGTLALLGLGGVLAAFARARRG